MSNKATVDRMMIQDGTKEKFDPKKKYTPDHVVITTHGKNEFDEHYEITKYLCSDTTFFPPGDMKFHNFDTVQFLKQSDHPKMKRVRAHFLAYRNGKNKAGENIMIPTVVIAISMKDKNSKKK